MQATGLSVMADDGRRARKGPSREIYTLGQSVYTSVEQM